MDEFVEMPSTMWTLLTRAREGNAGELDLLLRQYRPPVLAFVRSLVRDPEEAEDVTQEVFVTVLQDGILTKADRLKGRFRSLLLAVARHVVSERWRARTALKRGGNQRPLSLDRIDAPGDLPLRNQIEAPAADLEFDTLWVDNLIRIGMNRLREQSAKERTSYFDALFAVVNDGAAYAEIAERMGVSIHDVKNYVHQARLRLRRYLLQEIHSYSPSRDAAQAEIEYLLKLLEP
jgi:RNA polymerase sigma-70 factor (ECF subfamily)